jgi:uncharacterized protein (TIGR02246 family)
MKKLLMILPLAFLLCFTFGCQKAEEVAEEPAVDVETDMEAIRNLMNETIRTYNEGDFEGAMSLIADDAIWMPPNEPVIVGKEAIRNWYNEFKDTSFNVNVTSDELKLCGDWAYERATWTGTLTSKATGETTQIKATDMYIHQRQPDGSWKTSRAIWNFITFSSETEK